jgi:signal transduction histidine kinase/DNA-binding response OmpR family regulator/purine-cytosine permease-like protein
MPRRFGSKLSRRPGLASLHAGREYASVGRRLGDQMAVRQHVVRVRRDYNRWVANQTLEDFALRFTAKSARRGSRFRVANTAIGGISFLALEAIGGSITLTFGFTNAVAAILVVCAVIFLAGLPICYQASKSGVDIDLLTRGAGFGYLGSTINSLIYATFTFIFFAIEATIMATSLEIGLGLDQRIGLVLSAVVVIPLVTYGFTFLSRFQLWTQPLWVVMQLAPFVWLFAHDSGAIAEWTRYTGIKGPLDRSFNLALFGAASGVVFSLIAQIAEQVDFLRFLPPQRSPRDLAWWTTMLTAGPGWVVIGAFKLLAGSFLGYLAFKAGETPAASAEPSRMYIVAWRAITGDPVLAAGLATVFVTVSQLKINVTNSYAGSIAWSNFFSRLTHSHPGRVVWVVFNVVIALLLMEFGIYRTLEHTLGLYAHVAVAWVGALVADLAINKPLGLSPSGIEFKRAHLFDINPVGFGAMTAASLVGVAAYTGAFGALPAALSCYIALAVAFVCAPAIAWATRGRYYLARLRVSWDKRLTARCCICDHTFEVEDMTHCPIYVGPICSLCCTLDARCNDGCKTDSRLADKLQGLMTRWLPTPAVQRLNSSLGRYLGLMVLVCVGLWVVFGLGYLDALQSPGPPQQMLGAALVKIFFFLFLISGVVCWLFVLAHQSRTVAFEESHRQTALLVDEIEAHERTDRALQKAKEAAESANLAKTRYLAGISHEFRTPLNAILGYAQLLERDTLSPRAKGNAIRTIKRSGEHLATLVEGLLDISKIEAGHLRIETQAFSLPELLDQLVEMFRLQAESSGLTFDFSTSGLPVASHVRSDPKLLQQVLINLLSNAVKFTSRGGVRLHVDRRDDLYRFTVEDTGVGVAAADLERIFIPFERVGDSQTPGTGLGLTITKLLTGALGGELRVTSEPGVGSRFVARLYLPSAADPRAKRAQAEDEVSLIAPGLKILVADDDPNQRNLVRDMLAPFGVVLAEADNGFECVETAARMRPDLVLLDVSMPRFNGWEVAKILRESHQSTAAIVMVSADAAGAPVGAEHQNYHDAYVVKPFRIDALLGLMSRLVDVSGVRPQALGTPSASIPLPAKHVEDLLNLARIGYASAFVQRAEALRAEAPSASERGQFDLLIELAREMNFDGIVARLEGNRNARG